MKSAVFILFTALSIHAMWGRYVKLAYYSFKSTNGEIQLNEESIHVRISERDKILKLYEKHIPKERFNDIFHRLSSYDYRQYAASLEKGYVGCDGRAYTIQFGDDAIEPCIS